MINITHVITELNMGGAELMLQRLVSLMDRERFNNRVISLTDIGPAGENILAQGIPVLSVGMTLGNPSLSGLVKLIKILNEEKNHILQTWLYHADLMGFIANIFAGKKKIVWGIRCSDMDLKNYRLLTTLTVKLDAFFSPYVDKIISNSRRGMLFHKNLGYDYKKIKVIPNGFNTDQFIPDKTARTWLMDQLSIAEDNLLIGLIARYDPMKDHEGFLKAASIVAGEHCNVHFIMAGKDIDSKNRMLMNLIEKYGLEGRAHMMGLRNDIPRIMAGLDIAVSSSAYGEGFSNTIGEAMCCGIPCVATDVGDATEILSTSGIIVPPRDPDSMSKALKRLLSMNSEERLELGAKGRERIMNNYNIVRIVRQFEDFYEDLMKFNKSE